MTYSILTSEENYQSRTKDSKLPLLVDFSGKWCGACKLLKPRLEALSQEYDSRMDFLEVDVDTFPKIAAKEDVRSLPTLLFYNNGKLIKRIAPNKPNSSLREQIDQALNILSQ